MTSFKKILSAMALVAQLAAACDGGIAPMDTFLYTNDDGEKFEIDYFVDSSHDGGGSYGSKPAIIYFHGGSWVSGTREKIHQRYREVVLRHLLKKGFAVFSADYGLVGLGRGHLDGTVADSRSAIDFVFSNAERLGIDTSKIGLWGSSAGAHLAMMAAFADSATSKLVKFVVDDFGPVNIKEMFVMVPESVRVYISDFMFDMEVNNIATFDSVTAAFSPINYNTNLPILIFHGEDDAVVDISQSRQLHEKNPNNSHFITFSGNSHGLEKLDSTQLDLYVKTFDNFLDTVIVNNR